MQLTSTSRKCQYFSINVDRFPNLSGFREVKFWWPGGQENLGEGGLHLRREGRCTVQLALLVPTADLNT